MANRKLKLNDWRVWLLIIAVGVLIALGLLFFLVMDREPQLKLTSDSATMKIGETMDVPVEEKQGETMPEVAFTSENAAVASVTETGRITALREGETKILCATEGGQSVSMKVVVKGKKSSEKVIYLTYEGGPSREVTPALLKLLGKYDAKATFFPYAQEAEAYGEPVARAAREGHTVGVYTYSEDYSQIYKSVPAFEDDFTKTEKIIREILGRQPEYWRFPGGSVNDKITPEDKEVIMADLHRQGYVCVDWTCYVDDLVADKLSARNMAKTGIRTIDQAITMGQPPVVRMHDRTDNGESLQATEKIIKHYQKKGYKFLALSDYEGTDIIAGE